MAVQENKYREYEPSPILQPFLDCYWSYSANFTAKSQASSNPIIPDGCVDIIFDLNLPTQSECFVVGPMTKPIRNSKNNLFGVRFKPGKAVSFFLSPLREMTDQILTINRIGKFKSENIADQLVNSKCTSNKTFLIESIFEKILPERPALEKQVQYAINTIELSNGMKSIQEITNEIGWSRQHFTRQFLKNTGLTPKFFSQVIKVNRVLKIYKDKKCCYSLGELAQVGGYFDQAHMTNEFKNITGLTPQLFLKNA